MIFLGVSTAFSAVKTGKTEKDSIDIRYRFDPVIKTASKISGAQRDQVASITLIGGPELRNAPTDAVFELVKVHIPGIYVTEWGVMGFGVAGSAAGKISMRGIGGSADTHVLILRNGRPDFMGLMGCTIADEFSTDGVERIEVLRGPASFLYGTNATAGVINIVSARMTENGFRTEFGGGYGTFDSRKLMLSHGGKLGKLDYMLTGTSRRTDGHRTDANSRYQGNFFTSHAGYAPGKNTSLEWNMTYADMTIYDPGPDTGPFEDHRYDVLRYGGDVTLTHDGKLGETNLKLHGNFGKHNFYDGWHSTDRMLGAILYQNIKPWAGNMTTLGFDYKRYGGSAENRLSPADYGTYYITEYAPYMHVQQMFLKHFIASAGIRMERHSRYGSEILPKVGLVAHLLPVTSLRLSAAKGFRSPSIREMYFFPPQNADLEPERLWNVEAGATQYLGKRLKLDAVLFRSEGSNLVRASNPGFPFHWVNSGAFIHTGYELTADWMPVDGLTINTSWSKLDLGDQTLYSPGKKLTAYISYRFRWFSMALDFLHVMDLYGADFRKNPLKDYTLLNATLQTDVLRRINLKFSVKNVLDADYYAMWGYPMPGRHAAAEVRFSL